MTAEEILRPNAHTVHPRLPSPALTLSPSLSYTQTPHVPELNKPVLLPYDYTQLFNSTHKNGDFYIFIFIFVTIKKQKQKDEDEAESEDDAIENRFTKVSGGRDSSESEADSDSDSDEGFSSSNDDDDDDRRIRFAQDDGDGSESEFGVGRSKASVILCNAFFPFVGTVRPPPERNTLIRNRGSDLFFYLRNSP